MTTTCATATVTSRRSIIARNDDNEDDSSDYDDYGDDINLLLRDYIDQVQISIYFHLIGICIDSFVTPFTETFDFVYCFPETKSETAVTL